MRLTLNLLLATALLAVPARAIAQTSMNDLVGLKSAGFSDDLLIATFQSDGTIYYLTVDDLIYLRQQGLSERVLLAMLATRAAARDAVVPAGVGAAQPADPASQMATGGDTPRQEPVVVNVEQRVTQTVEQRNDAPRRGHSSRIFVPVAVPVAVRPARPKPAPEPVYWGFGGQRRPGTWDPASTSRSRRGSSGDGGDGARGRGAGSGGRSGGGGAGGGG